MSRQVDPAHQPIIEPTKEEIVTDTTIALVQFMQAHDGDLTMLPGLVFDLKEVATHHGVTDAAFQ